MKYPKYCPADFVPLFTYLIGYVSSVPPNMNPPLGDDKLFIGYDIYSMFAVQLSGIDLVIPAMGCYLLFRTGFISQNAIPLRINGQKSLADLY